MGQRQKTFAFILHFDKLIYWIQDEPMEIGKKVLLAQDGVWARRLRQIDANSFAFMVKKDEEDPG